MNPIAVGGLLSGLDSLESCNEGLEVLKLLEARPGGVGDFLKTTSGDPKRGQPGEMTVNEGQILQWRIHGAFTLLQGGADQNVSGLVAESGFAQLLFGHVGSEVETRDSAKAQQGESEKESQLVMVALRGAEYESMVRSAARRDFGKASQRREFFFDQ